MKRAAAGPAPGWSTLAPAHASETSVSWISRSEAKIGPSSAVILKAWVPGGDEMAIKPGATPQAREAARQACVALADARATALAPIISEIRASGITSPFLIAAALSARGIPTARGHRVWGDGPVRKLLNRMDRLAAAGAAGPTQGQIALP
jgi:hypothetical protein